MKSSRIMTLVLAAAVLAVVASGSAFAQTNWPKYTNPTISHYYDSSPSISQTSYGNMQYVAAGDTVGWDNTLWNHDSHSVTGYVGAGTYPYYGLVYNEEPVQNIAANDDGYANDHRAEIEVAGYHQVIPYHAFQDGQNFYTATGNADSMEYN